MLNLMSAKGVWIGHLYLRPPGAEAAGRVDQVTVELEGAVPDTEGLLSLRALAPLASLPESDRRHLRVLLAGERSELTALTVRSLKVEKLSLWEKEPIEEDERFHRILFGCEGKTPDKGQLKPLVARLRQDGELLLFDLPAEDVVPLHQRLAKDGFALRSAGSEGRFGYLSGSVEAPSRFAN